MEKRFDVVIIGAGPGGYVTAIRCAQLGLKTACIDARMGKSGKASPGGTCLNVGCIPSKVLLESSENYDKVAHKFARQGIRVENVSLDLPTMMARKERIVDTFTRGITYLFKKNEITFLHGTAELLSAGEPLAVEVKTEAGSEVLQAGHVVIACGSYPASIKNMPIDHVNVVDSTDALSFTAVPTRLGIIGAGVIGLELGSVWRRLGSEVILFEALEGFLPAVDEEISRQALKLLKAQGLDIRLGVSVESVEIKDEGVVLVFKDQEGEHRMSFDKVAVAVGRTPATQSIGAEKAGLKLDQKGFIVVNEYCQTNLLNVYAVGDTVRGPMLAHKASEEGVMVAERIAGRSAQMNYKVIPWVIYTSPEIAWVGQTEQQLKMQGLAYRSGSFPFSANGRAQSLDAREGLVKIMADAETDQVLGVHILGPYAAEMIAEAVVAMEFSAGSKDVARIIHAHPSLPEVMKEAALSVSGHALHI